jgi:IPT/TIG domain-containing protein
MEEPMLYLGRVDCRVFRAFLAAATAFVLARASVAKTIKVPLSHASTAFGTLVPVNISANDELSIEISDTDPACYFYNLREATPPPGLKDLAAGAPVVVLTATHDESVSQYIVEITKKARATCSSPAGRWVIPVRPFWEFGFAAGFTGDGLTDPVYFLEPTTLPAVGTEPARNGFFVRRDVGAEDSFKLGAAGLIHLIPRLNILGGVGPALSFGLSLDDETQTKYLLGLSLRFGARFYLSGGWAFGSRRRRTSGPTFENANGSTFTQDPNALASLGKKSGSAVFVGLSYTFLDVGLQPFRNVVAPAPAPPPLTAPPKEEEAPKPVITKVEPESEEIGKPITITGTGFGPVTANGVIFFEQEGIKENVESTSPKVTWTTTAVTVLVPSGLNPGVPTRITISPQSVIKSDPYSKFTVKTP